MCTLGAYLSNLLLLKVAGFQCAHHWLVLSTADILFATLALVEAVIDRDQLAAAYAEWINRKGVSLADILVEKGWLRPEDRQKVEQSIRRHRSRYLQETQSTLENFAPAPSQKETNGPRPVASSADETTVPDARSPDEPVRARRPDGPRYTLTRLHGEGGVGASGSRATRSSPARSPSRSSAPGKRSSPMPRPASSTKRRVTGQLQHPGIVPVYELSSHQPDERPFYTMRFLKGKTLTEAVEAYHKLRAAGQVRAVELRELLGAFLAVCQVIAYAHSRGVLHRDLKGQNIVLGDFGEVMVLDWGLAKVIAGRERGPSSAEHTSASEQLRLTREHAGEKTLDGTVLGTPGYMSPEQAEGRLDDLDERTDVYGLGAIVYHILTGEAPFGGRSVSTILARVIREAPEPPRRLVATVAPSSRRSASSAWPRSRPIVIPQRARARRRHPELPRRRAGDGLFRALGPSRGRWLGRHRTLAAVSAATLLVATISLAVAAVLLGAANDREAKARAQAEAHFQTAREAVDQFLSKVGDDPRLKAHGLERPASRPLETSPVLLRKVRARPEHQSQRRG